MTAPRLTIGLPVYNGERYLREALDALLAQTFTDFELIIADNASTDRTREICEEYAARDARVRYVRQPRNLGAGPNHNTTIDLARGRYFKWASHDDLYAPTLLERCVALLDERPDIVLAHSWDGMIDEHGDLVSQEPYPLQTADPDPAVRLRSLLETPGGNDFYGVARTEVFRSVGGQSSYHNSDRTFVAAVALHGPFAQVPEVLYYRRDHPDRGERARSHRARAAIGDPRLANRWRYPMARLYAAYLLGYVTAINDAPLSVRDRLRCLGELGRWLARRGAPGHRSRLPQTADPAVLARQAASGGAPRTTSTTTSTNGPAGGPADDLAADPADDAAPTRIRVAAFGYFGIGNLGNEASLRAFGRWLAREHPEVELSAIAVGPDEVTRDHAIPAARMMTYRRDLASGSVLITLLKTGGRLLDVPRALRNVRRVDAVVVPGSGVLETGLGIPPWGLPYWLLLLALACRVQRRRLALVSVGAQYATHPVTRFCYRWTVRLATWVSVRDEASREALRAMGVGRRIPVHPDLVFGEPTPAGRPVRPGHVGIGVMAYYGGPDSPRRGPAVRAAYTASMADLVRGLADDGHTVTLVIGDLADEEVAEEVAAAAGRPDRVRVSPARTLDEVLVDLSEAEVVVASRFHNIIAALELGRPTISLGYARKSADLLSAFGLDDLSQPMDGFDVVRLRAQIDRAAAIDDAVQARMKEVLAGLESSLQDQYRALGGVLFDNREIK